MMKAQLAMVQMEDLMARLCQCAQLCQISCPACVLKGRF
jgi:hypothetical protein